MMNTLRRPIKKTLAAIAVVVLVVTLTAAQRTGAPQQTGQSIKGADIKGRAPLVRIGVSKHRG